MITAYRKLGELLLTNEVITNLQLSIALAAQQTSSRRLGEILVERGFATEQEIAQCLAQQYNYPMADLSAMKPSQEALDLFGVESALEWGALPVGLTKTQLTVVIADPIDVMLTDEMSERFNRRVAIYIAPESELREAILTAYGHNTPMSEEASTLGVVPPRFINPVPHHRLGCVSVYEAHDSDLNRPVSLFAVAESEPDFQNHVQNVRAVASASSKHLCPIYDSFILDGVRWTVTPPVKGETLENVLRTRGRRTVAQAAEVVSGIAFGIDAINQISGGCGLVCAANVLIGPEGNYLGPFSKPGNLYLAPEIRAGGQPTPASDVYALGVLLMECISGVAFGENAEPGSPWELDVPVALQDLFANCLASDPELRLSSAIELASALQAFDWTVVSRQDERISTMTERDVLLRGFVVTEKENRNLWSRLFGRVDGETRAA